MVNLKRKKGLIANFSRRGENYVSGSIKKLAIGNTELIAGMIREKIGSDLFQIETIKVYPVDYTEVTEVAKKELRDNVRPDIFFHIGQ